MSEAFKDHFSAHSASYSKSRPTYPEHLFEFLAGASPERKLAWDCATGNGQAAIPLTRYFDMVLATDASANQIANCMPGPSLQYSIATSYKSGLKNGCCDLITVAQALHWFDFEAFWHECRRVARHGALLAVWSYNLLAVTPAIDAVLNYFYFDVVGDFWPEERTHLEKDYRDVGWPFARIQTPKLQMQVDWTLDNLLGYLYTWSATQRFIKAHDENPVDLIKTDLMKAWGRSECRHIEWPLNLIAGHIS